MGLTVTLPDDLAQKLDHKVAQGDFSSRDEAAAYYVRKGMEGGGGGWRREPPGDPPGTPQPPNDRPIQVDPTDVNWA